MADLTPNRGMLRGPTASIVCGGIAGLIFTYLSWAFIAGSLTDMFNGAEARFYFWLLSVTAVVVGGFVAAAIQGED